MSAEKAPEVRNRGNRKPKPETKPTDEKSWVLLDGVRDWGTISSLLGPR